MNPKQRGVPALAWAGLAILVFAAALLSLGQRDLEAMPNSDSYGPSGTSALYHLLADNGYRVRSDLSARPRLTGNDLVIAFFKPHHASLLEDISESMADPESGDKYEDPTQDSLHTFLDHGGTALLMPIDNGFPEASQASLKQQDIRVDSPYSKASFLISSVSPVTTPFLDRFKTNHDQADALWTGPQHSDLVYGLKVGEGDALVLANGILATNRFIDRSENAAFLMRLIDSLGGREKQIVLLESTFDDPVEPSLLQAIGPWANAGWQQFLLLAIVIVYTLGKRLGLPEVYRARQRGSRELVDAVADTMMRARSTQFAARIALDQADLRLRAALNLPRDVDRSRRDELLPVTLQSAMSALELSSQHNTQAGSETLRQIRRVDEELEAFLGRRQKHRYRRAKL